MASHTRNRRQANAPRAAGHHDGAYHRGVPAHGRRLEAVADHGHGVAEAAHGADGALPHLRRLGVLGRLPPLAALLAQRGEAVVGAHGGQDALLHALVLGDQQGALRALALPRRLGVRDDELGRVGAHVDRRPVDELDLVRRRGPERPVLFAVVQSLERPGATPRGSWLGWGGGGEIIGSRSREGGVSELWEKRECVCEKYRAEVETMRGAK